MSDDISRRIDDLLSGAIDEQVREQRALSDMMTGVRDGVSRLVGDVAALSARVTESRETAQGLREELPFLVQREVTTAVNAMSTRIDVLETAVGELVASVAGLEDRVGPDVIVNSVAQKLESMRSAREEEAGTATAEAARTTIEDAAETLRALVEDEAGAMRASFEQASTSMTELVERHHAQISRRLTDVKKWTDDVESRMKALEKALEANVKMPTEVRKQLNELTGATQDMTDSVLEEIRLNAEAAAGRIGASVEGLDREAVEINRRFVEINDRMAAFQEQVLAYLQVRDVALEERRDQIVTELLADFLNELPDKERERTVGRLRTVFARRRDKRDAERYRTGGPGATTLPAVSPEAVRRAEAELQREQRLAERPWAADRSWAEPAKPAGRAAASEPEPEPVYEDEPEPDALEVEEPAARPAPARKAPPKKSAAKKTAAKKPAAKKTAAKKTAAKKPAAKKAAARQSAPEPVESPEAGFAPGPDDALEAEQAEFEAGELGVVETPAVVDETGDIDVVEMQAFAEPDVEAEEEVTPRSKASPAKKAAAKPKPRPRAKPAPAEAPSRPSVAADAPPAEVPTGEVPAGLDAAAAAGEEGEDTLQQALARVQALVDQHRKPGGGRKRT